MKRCDFLVLQFSPTGRDAEAIIPLCWYLENVYKYTLCFGSMFDAGYLIDKYRPRAILLNNVSGSEFNVAAASYATKKKVLVISLISEGLLRPGEMDSFIWGNNTQKIVNWNKMYFWSHEFCEMAKEYLPQASSTFDFGGSTGIDRYKIYHLLDKKVFLQKYKKKRFKKIIMYGGFNFGWVFEGSKKPEKAFYLSEMSKVKTTLLKLVTEHTDILFIFKKHPGEKRTDMEIDYNWRFDNLLIFSDEIPIGDLINICDLYLIYRSSTTFEAYALNKPVINMWPLKKHETYQEDDQRGNCSVNNYTGLKKYILEYYETYKLEDYNRRKDIRSVLIRKKIGAIDGLNSFRTAKKINKYLMEISFLVDVVKNGTTLKNLVLHMFLKFNKWLFFIPRFRNSRILKEYNEFYKFFDLKQKYNFQIRKHFQEKIEKFYRL